MIKKIESVEGIPQTVEEKLEVIRLKINEIIEHYESRKKDI